jgi:hypothetical protein
VLWFRRVMVMLLAVALLACGLRLKEDEAQLRQLRERGVTLGEALDEANSNIQELDEEIDDAQGESGGSYYDMADALDSLSPREEIEVPPEVSRR